MRGGAYTRSNTTAKEKLSLSTGSLYVLTDEEIRYHNLLF